jgi:hypothetical protein
VKGIRDRERRDAVLALLREGWTARAACKQVGLARSALYAWVARGGDEELEAAVKATSKARYTGPKPGAGTPASTSGKAPTEPTTPLRPTPPTPAAPPPPAVGPGSSGAPRVSFAPENMPEEQFVQRLRALGLQTLAKLAAPLDQGGAKAEGARVAAARELVLHAERWEAVRRGPLEEPDAARTAPAPEPEKVAEPELTPEAAAARFRVVKGA